MSRASRFATFVSAVAAMLLLAGCPPTSNPGTPSAPIPPPTLVQVLAPDESNAWAAVDMSTGEALPTRGRGVRLIVTSPLGSVFGVAIVSGTARVELDQNRGTPAPPEAGYFQVIEASPDNPSTVTLYVRAPEALPSPTDFTIEVVHKSLRTDVGDSTPLSIALHRKPVFSVSVTVTGSGHVTSNPAGLMCGPSPSNGRPLTPCKANFPAGTTVQLIPGGNQGARFRAWGGDCDPTVQVCQLTMDGNGKVVSARFDGTTTQQPSNCPEPPQLPGLRWIDIPACATGSIDSHPGITNPAVCDAAGYFCCEPGPPGAVSARCGGTGKIQSTPDCRQHAPRGQLRQPGGCYEAAP